jgi:hypothetical protein
LRTERHREIVMVALCYLHKRGVLEGSFPLDPAEAVDHEMKLTPEERAQAVALADEFERDRG